MTLETTNNRVRERGTSVRFNYLDEGEREERMEVRESEGERIREGERESEREREKKI